MPKRPCSKRLWRPLTGAARRAWALTSTFPSAVWDECANPCGKGAAKRPKRAGQSAEVTNSLLFSARTSWSDGSPAPGLERNSGVGWREGFQGWNREARSPGSGAGWALMAFGIGPLLVALWLFIDTGNTVSAIAAVMGIVVLAIGAFTQRAKWRRRK